MRRCYRDKTGWLMIYHHIGKNKRMISIRIIDKIGQNLDVRAHLSSILYVNDVIIILKSLLSLRKVY